MPIVRASPVPLYYQIQRCIREEISGRGLRPGNRIESEADLAQRYGVSRMTVRHAIAHLIQQGVLYAVHGRGTFVAHPGLEREPAKVASLFSDMVAKGYRPRSEVLRREVLGADARVARALRLQMGEPVIMIQRLRLADEEPMALQTNFVPQCLCPGLLEHDLSTTSLQQILETTYGLNLAKANDRIQALPADRHQAKLLGIAPGAPLLYVERLVFLLSGTPATLADVYFRGDRCTYNTSVYEEPHPLPSEADIEAGLAARG